MFSIVSGASAHQLSTRHVRHHPYGVVRNDNGPRWQCETGNSMIKRLLGSALRARTYWRQCREITLRAITLNVLILRRQIGGFLQSTPDPFSSSGERPVNK